MRNCEWLLSHFLLHIMFLLYFYGFLVMNINNGVINLNSLCNNDTRFYIVFTIFIYLFAGHSSTFHKIPEYK